jgi:hypothetical protein
MSNRKRGRAAKGRALSQVRAKAVRSGEHTRRATSKQARVLQLLRRLAVGQQVIVLDVSSDREMGQRFRRLIFADPTGTQPQDIMYRN